MKGIRLYRTRCLSLKSHPSIEFHATEEESETKGIDILKECIPILNHGNHAFTTQEIEEAEEW